mgnify:CR=1 FL=1
MNHPYKMFEKSKLWNSIEKIIDELVENQDIIENTPRVYIIGYICKRLDEEYGLFTDSTGN